MNLNAQEEGQITQIFFIGNSLERDCMRSFTTDSEDPIKMMF